MLSPRPAALSRQITSPSFAAAGVKLEIALWLPLRYTLSRRASVSASQPAATSHGNGRWRPWPPRTACCRPGGQRGGNAAHVRDGAHDAR